MKTKESKKFPDHIELFRGQLHFRYTNKGATLRRNLKITESEYSKRENQLIVSKVINDFNKALFEYKKNDANNLKNPPIEYINEMVFGGGLNIDKNDLLHIYDTFLKEIESKINIKTQSVIPYKSLRENISDYIDSIKNKRKEIDEKLLTGFLDFLYKSEKEYGLDTLRKKTIYYKKFIKFLDKNKYINFKVTFEEITIKKPQKQVETLTKDELKATIEFYQKTNDDRYKQTLSMFLFQCFTSLRYSDLIQISEDKVDIKNNLLSMISQKQENQLKIKLDNFLLDILKQNNFKLNYFKPTPYLSNIREIFAIIADDVHTLKDEVTKIKKTAYGTKVTKKLRYQLFGSHTARRTFITIQIIIGTNVVDIMNCTGHETPHVLYEYIDIYNKMKANENINISKNMFNYINK